MALKEDRFERVSELFYEAAGIPESWPDALDALADACGASGAVLSPVRPGASKVVCSRGISELIARQVSEGWHASNPRMRRGLELTDAGWLGLITDRDMFGEESAFPPATIPLSLSNTASAGPPAWSSRAPVTT